MKNITDLIKRNTPNIAEKFIFEIIEKENNCDVYEFETKDDKIILRGNNSISIAAAYWKYLKMYCKACKSHCGTFDLDIKTAPLPDKFRRTIKQNKRVYLDYITESNSTWLWDWERWEKEIDFMAMCGFNMALNVVGNDALLFYTLMKMDFSSKEAAFFVSGPAFYAWQITNKINMHLPRKNFERFDEELNLAKKIVDRMKELGIEPVLSTFNGMIPKSATKLYNKAKSNVFEPWNEFGKTYRLNIDDPFFKKFSKEYMNIQDEKIGASNYYMCTQLCNFTLKQNRKTMKYLINSAEIFDKMMDFFGDEKVCLIFPSEGYIDEFVSNIKKCDTMIFDVDGTMYKETNYFNGHPFVLGNSHDNSPHVSLHGDMNKLASNLYAEVSNECDNIIGCGFFPESLEQNPIYHDLAFEMVTESDKIILDDWIKQYAASRYGTDNIATNEAIKLLVESCYSGCDGDVDIGSVICTRPTPEIRHTAPFDILVPSYDNSLLFKSCIKLLESETYNDNIKYDIVFILRQAIDNSAYAVYQKIMQCYKERNREEFDNNVKIFLELIDDIDELVTTVPEGNSFDAFKTIRNISCDTEEEVNNILCYLGSHTIWGPMTEATVRYDYNWICLSELITAYYRVRWDKFFENLTAYFGKTNIQTKSTRQIYDRDLYTYSQFYKDMAKFEKSVLIKFDPQNEEKKDTIEISKKLIEKYYKG